MSITLTTAPSLNNTLGGNTLIDYDHVVLSPLNFDAVNKTITGTVRLTSTTSPDTEVVFGTLNIAIGPGILTFQVPQLDLIHKSTLTPGQIISVQGFLDDAQASIENGLIAVGVIDGVESAGT